MTAVRAEKAHEMTRLPLHRYPFRLPSLQEKALLHRGPYSYCHFYSYSYSYSYSSC